MDIPPFHPEWLVTFWLTTPGLNRLDPHLTLLFVLVTIIGGIYIIKRKNRPAVVGFDEEKFQLLFKKKTILEEELARINSLKQLDENHLLKKKELEKQLEQTFIQLKEFTQ